MNKYCLEELEDKDLIPCVICYKLHHHSQLNGEYQCELCLVQIRAPEAKKKKNQGNQGSKKGS